MHRRYSRRRLLAAAGSIGVVAVAGCSGDADDGDDPEDDDTEDDEPAPANESNAGGGNATDGESSPMPEPVDWTDEERGTVSVGPDGDAAFDPDAVRIEPGTTVRWLWKSDGHTVVPVDRPEGADWDGEVDTYGEGHSYEFTFETPGTYEYVCEPHEEAGMRGYVVVSED